MAKQQLDSSAMIKSGGEGIELFKSKTLGAVSKGGMMRLEEDVFRKYIDGVMVVGLDRMAEVIENGSYGEATKAVNAVIQMSKHRTDREIKKGMMELPKEEEISFDEGDNPPL